MAKDLKEIPTNMENATAFSNGKYLWLRIDPAVDLGPSKSGKTKIVASSGGFSTINLPGGPVMVNLNVCKK